MPIDIFSNPNAVARAAAEMVVTVANAAVAERGQFTIALSGGSTPKLLFALLADTAEPFRARMPWNKTLFFFGDERHVPPEHEESNYRMAMLTMLSKAPVPRENIHRIRAENPDAASAASAYNTRLIELLCTPPQTIPVFDLILLGMGPDGHTASLFPGSAALHDTSAAVVANWVEKFNAFRITFTYPTINAARHVAFLITGLDKAPVLNHVLTDANKTQYPSQGVHPTHGTLDWMLDAAAATELPETLKMKA
jgi:6-phosphogluconolactonase